MRRKISGAIIVITILLSSFISTVNFRNYLFIHCLSYVFLASGICFSFVLFKYTPLVGKKEKTEFWINLTDLSILVLFCYLLIRYIFSPQFNSMPDNILFIVIIAFSYFYIKYVSGNNNKKIVKIILYSILFAGLLQMFYGFLQLAGILPNLFQFKFGGSFGNPGDLVNFLIIPYTVTLGLFFCEKKKAIRFFLFLSVILYIFLFVISFARTGWIACIVSSAFLLYYLKSLQIGLLTLWNVNKKHISRYFIIFIIALSLIVFTSHKLYSFKRSSAEGRIFIWKQCAGMIYEKPIFGHGYESLLTELGRHQMNYFRQHSGDIKNGWYASEPVFAFNDYLQISVEFGIVALLLLLFSISRAVFFKYPKIPNEEFTILAIIRSAIIGVLICMFFSYPLKNASIMFCFFVLIALVSSFETSAILKFTITRKHVLASLLIMFIFLSAILAQSSNSIINGLKWKKAFAGSESGKGNYVIKYENIFNSLKSDKSFIMNYGSILHKSKRYSQCIDLYERYGYLCLSSDMYLILGECYEKTKNYKKAEDNYKNASFLIPHLFMPKYSLFKLYEVTNQPVKMDSIAVQISTMKIKIFSEIVRKIKTEVNEYLLLKKQGIKN